MEKLIKMKTKIWKILKIKSKIWKNFKNDNIMEKINKFWKIHISRFFQYRKNEKNSFFYGKYLSFNRITWFIYRSQSIYIVSCYSDMIFINMINHQIFENDKSWNFLKGLISSLGLFVSFQKCPQFFNTDNTCIK